MRILPHAISGNIFLSKWRPYAWLALAILAVYFRSVGFGFTNLDDTALIVNNYPFLSKISNIVNAFGQKVFSHSVLPYYRPILTASLILDANLGGVNPFIYHLDNLLIHILATYLVYVFLIRIGLAKTLSFVFSLIFAVHPALVPAVVWIPGRNDSLLAVFALLSFVSFIDFLKMGGWPRYLSHILFFMVALFTKESALMLVVLTGLYGVLFYRRTILSRTGFKLAAGYILTVSLWYAARSIATAGSYDMSLYDAARFFFAYLPAVLQLLGKAVLPLNLNVFPTMHDTSVIYGIVALILIAYCLFLSKKKNNAIVAFGTAWFFLFLVPSLVRPHAGVINDVLEHRLYVPIIGLMLVFSEMDFLKNWRRGYAVPALCLILSFGALSMWRSDDFRDKLTFWERAVGKSPNSPYAHLLLGVAYFDEGEGGRAEKEFQKAISLDPQMIRAHYYMGLVYMQDGQFPEASREFRKEISLHPEFDPSYSSLAVAYYKMGRREDIEILWKRAIELNPGNLEAYKNLAIYYYNLGDIKSAKEYVRQLEDRGVTVPSDFLDALNTPKGN